MKEIIVAAIDENLEVVNNFIHECLMDTSVSDDVLMELDLAVEEIFVNIAHYAYNPEVGNAQIKCKINNEPLQLTIEFTDEGKPYNPLEKEDPDITLSAEERQIGGLGIFIVKQFMDVIEYRYEDNKNILTIKKML